MKNIFILFLLFFSANAFAQKSDTLIVPVGKYQFIKVGDKVYKINTTLEEVKDEEGVWKGIQLQTTPNIQYYNQSQLLPLTYSDTLRYITPAINVLKYEPELAQIPITLNVIWTKGKPTKNN